MNDTKSNKFIGKEIPNKNNEFVDDSNIQIEYPQILDSCIEDSRIYAESEGIYEEKEYILSQTILSFALKGECFMNDEGETRNQDESEQCRVQIKPTEYVR